MTTFDEQNRDVESRTSRSSGVLPKPDRVFSCGGKGIKGAITEFRYGLEAIINFEMDYEVPITQAWILYPDPGNFEEQGTSTILMTVADGSAVLKLADYDLDPQALDQESTPFGLGSRTITAAIQGSTMVQVTEQSIVVVFRSSS